MEVKKKRKIDFLVGLVFTSLCAADLISGSLSTSQVQLNLKITSGG